ncbi:MAG: hypothetical protein C4589_11495 [Peptococcaceae bacterium]|nr:MAG: hypothetical protein C4589_11495 [Peptococcaceae bacterium]
MKILPVCQIKFANIINYRKVAHGRHLLPPFCYNRIAGRKRVMAIAGLTGFILAMTEKSNFQDRGVKFLRYV